MTFLSLDVTFDAQVSPRIHKLANFGDKRSVAKMRKLLVVRIKFDYLLILDVELEMVAVRADDGFRKSDRLIAAGPSGMRVPGLLLLLDRTVICKILLQVWARERCL